MLLIPPPTFASILLPKGSDLAAGLYTPLMVYWNLFILGIAALTSVLHKKILFRTILGIALIPHILYGIFFLTPTIGAIISSSDLILPYLELTIPVVIIAGLQVIVLAFLLKYMFYKPNISKKMKIILFLSVAMVISFFIPKELFSIRDQGLYFANEKPLECTCIGIPAGEPGDFGYYCFGMPVACRETENKREPIQINLN